MNKSKNIGVECGGARNPNCPYCGGKNKDTTKNEGKVMKLTPTLDRVAIIREEKKKTSKGGIILPDSSKEESNYGTVLAVGPGGFNQDGSRREMSVKKGDVVFFTDYHVTQTESTESKVVIVDDEDILAIVK